MNIRTKIIKQLLYQFQDSSFASLFKHVYNTIDCYSKADVLFFDNMRIYFLAILFTIATTMAMAAFDAWFVCFNRSHKYFLHLHTMWFIADGIYVFKMCVRLTANIIKSLVYSIKSSIYRYIDINNIFRINIKD